MPPRCAAGSPTKIFTLESRATGNGEFQLTPSIALLPGREYLLEFTFFQRDYLGNLALHGDRVDRNYRLPADGGRNAFGSAPGQRKSIILWTSGDAPETIQLSFRPLRPTAFMPLSFGQVRMTVINRESLPVKLESLVPYLAHVRASAPAWLVTPRMFLPGYEAYVDGREAEVHASPQGLLMIRVPAGPVRVELRYVGPPLVRLALFITCATWMCLLVLAITRRSKLVKVSPTAHPEVLPLPRPIAARSNSQG